MTDQVETIRKRVVSAVDDLAVVLKVALSAPTEAERVAGVIKAVEPFVEHIVKLAEPLSKRAPTVTLEKASSLTPERILAIAKASPSLAAQTFHAGELMSAQRAHAAAIKRDGETDAAARARAWDTPEGRALRKALATAAPAPEVEKSTGPVPDKTASDAFAEIHRRAVKLRADPANRGMSEAAARMAVRRADPDLAAKERSRHAPLSSWSGGKGEDAEPGRPDLDAAAEVDALARELMAKEPGKWKSLAHARNHVRETNKQLAFREAGRDHMGRR